LKIIVHVFDEKKSCVAYGWLCQPLFYGGTNEGVWKMRKYAFYILFLSATVGIYAQSVDIDEAIKNAADYFERRLPEGTVITILNVESDSERLSN
jgi:hypothetical protein